MIPSNATYTRRSIGHMHPMCYQKFLKSCHELDHYKFNTSPITTHKTSQGCYQPTTELSEAIDNIRTCLRLKTRHH